MRAKPKPPRNTFTPKLLVKQLAEDVPGFKFETRQVQVALASLVWIGATKPRQHAVHDGYMSFHHTDLAAQFGGEFKAINGRLGFLEIKKKENGKDSWRWSADAQASDVFTKAYRFSPVVQASREAFLKKRVTRLSPLLDASGQAFRKPGSAVASLDTKGIPTTRWQVANDGDRLTRVPVNIATLRKFLRKYSEDADTWKRTGCAPSDDLLTSSPGLESLLVLRDKTAQIIRAAHTDVVGLGNILHRYVESPSGRLYANGGGSLQNAPKEIRKAALVGMWDYDVENCHFAIMAQMAKWAGVHCDAIEYYMAHKERVRAEISNAIGINIEDTKTCLLALMYGARTTIWHKNAIPEAIGNKAALLYALPQFANIADDVERARNAILAQHPVNRQGGLVNAFEKSLDTKKREKRKGREAKKAKTASQQLAHLVQGVEALALWTCIERHPGEIVLVQHDGFTATKQLAKAELELAITAATGYALTLKETLVQPHLDEQYAKAVEKESKNEFLKVRKARKASNGAGFGHVLPHSKDN